MSWKKSKVSYVLWLVYAVAVCAGLLSVIAEICVSTGRSQRLGILVTGAALVLSGVTVLILHHILRNRRLPGWVNQKAGYVTEGVCVLALLAGGSILRIMWLYQIPDAGESMVYYETAKVVSGQTIPQIV
ncbi:MAG: hypothetical protein IJF07_06640, partial [Lachnospiraceae bacterium]|nr:hypothetical protein [Lachnospiraceae bacterium]